jgi:hypothetical protein
MAISFVGSHVGTHAAVSAQTVLFSNLRNESNAQPTLQQNDVVFVAVENASTVNRSTGGGADVLVPSGYTGIDVHDYQDDSNDSNFRVSYKVMGATPDTSVAIPASNATTAGVAYAIYVFRGLDQASIQDTTAVRTGGIDTGIANAAAILPVTAGAWVVAFAGAAVASGAVFTNPAGMDSTTNHFRSATITSTTNDANIGGAIFSGWSSGSFDPAAFGGSTSTNTGSWSAVTLALRPANVLRASAGSFALTGSPANLKVGRRLSASAGGFALSGSAATLRRALKLTASSGAFSLSGSPASLKLGRVIAAGSGSFIINGPSVSLTTARKLGVSATSFALTGSPAALGVGHRLVGDFGSFSLGDHTAVLGISLRLAAASGSFALNCLGAALPLTYAFRVSPGAFWLAQSAAKMTRDRPYLRTRRNRRRDAYGPDYNRSVNVREG